MTDESLAQIAASLEKIARHLEILAPVPVAVPPLLGAADAYHWDAAADRLMPVPKVARVPFGLLKGIDRYFTAKGKAPPARRGAEADAER